MSASLIGRGNLSVPRHSHMSDNLFGSLFKPYEPTPLKKRKRGADSAPTAESSEPASKKSKTENAPSPAPAQGEKGKKGQKQLTVSAPTTSTTTTQPKKKQGKNKGNAPVAQKKAEEKKKVEGNIEDGLEDDIEGFEGMEVEGDPDALEEGEFLSANGELAILDFSKNDGENENEENEDEIDLKSQLEALIKNHTKTHGKIGYEDEKDGGEGEEGAGDEGDGEEEGEGEGEEEGEGEGDDKVKKDVSKSEVQTVLNSLKKTTPLAPAPAPTKSEKGITTAFVGGFPVGTSRSAIREFFKGCGHINDVRVITNNNAAKTTFVCFVEFRTEAGLKKAVEMNGSDFQGKYLEIKPAATSNTPQKHKKQIQTFTLFVKNLAFKTTEEKLRQTFEKCGEISTVRIPTHKDSGKSTGFAFVEFTTNEALQKALHKNMSKIKLDGRQLILTGANKIKI